MTLTLRGRGLFCEPFSRFRGVTLGGRHGIAPSYQSVCSDVRPRKCELALCQNCVT